MANGIRLAAGPETAGVWRSNRKREPLVAQGAVTRFSAAAGQQAQAKLPGASLDKGTTSGRTRRRQGMSYPRLAHYRIFKALSAIPSRAIPDCGQTRFCPQIPAWQDPDSAPDSPSAWGLFQD